MRGPDLCNTEAGILRGPLSRPAQDDDRACVALRALIPRRHPEERREPVGGLGDAKSDAAVELQVLAELVGEAGREHRDVAERIAGVEARGDLVIGAQRFAPFVGQRRRREILRMMAGPVVVATTWTPALSPRPNLSVSFTANGRIKPPSTPSGLMPLLRLVGSVMKGRRPNAVAPGFSNVSLPQRLNLARRSIPPIPEYASRSADQRPRAHDAVGLEHDVELGIVREPDPDIGDEEVVAVGDRAFDIETRARVAEELVSTWKRPASTVNGLSVVSGRSVVRSRSSRSGVGLNSVYWLLFGSEASATPAARARRAAANPASMPRPGTRDLGQPAIFLFTRGLTAGTKTSFQPPHLLRTIRNYLDNCRHCQVNANNLQLQLFRAGLGTCRGWRLRTDDDDFDGPPAGRRSICSFAGRGVPARLCIGGSREEAVPGGDDVHRHPGHRAERRG